VVNFILEVQGTDFEWGTAASQAPLTTAPVHDTVCMPTFVKIGSHSWRQKYVPRSNFKL